MIVRSRKYLTDGEPVPGLMLSGVIEEHEADAERMRKLRDAYDNRRAISKRTRPNGMPNNKLAHGFAHYITTMATGYMLGNPVKYQSADQQDALDTVMAEYKRADTQSVDDELARDASALGKGVELIFSDAESRPRCAALDPISAFVVYDDTVENRPLFGVHIQNKTKIDGSGDGLRVSVYTEYAIFAYDVAKINDLKSAQPEVMPHYFGSVPMVEYWNNDSETGDFEQVETLIDAYDALESDRVNDKQQVVDALLVLTGVRMDADDRGRTPAQQLREDKILCLPDSEASAEYLARGMSETDVEVLKNALKADIHKFSLVPDLTDMEFAANASGVAMRYKLLGLEQLTKGKERWFKEALKTRLDMFAAFLSVKGAKRLDTGTVSIIFTRSLPVNELETAQMVATLQGIVPSETLLTQVPFVEDVQATLDKLKTEKDEAVKRQQEQFGMNLDGAGDE